MIPKHVLLFLILLLGCSTVVSGQLDFRFQAPSIISSCGPYPVELQIVNNEDEVYDDLELQISGGNLATQSGGLQDPLFSDGFTHRFAVDYLGTCDSLSLTVYLSANCEGFDTDQSIQLYDSEDLVFEEAYSVLLEYPEVLVFPDSTLSPNGLQRLYIVNFSDAPAELLVLSASSRFGIHEFDAEAFSYFDQQSQEFVIDSDVMQLFGDADGRLGVNDTIVLELDWERLDCLDDFLDFEIAALCENTDSCRSQATFYTISTELLARDLPRVRNIRVRSRQSFEQTDRVILEFVNEGSGDTNSALYDAQLSVYWNLISASQHFDVFDFTQVLVGNEPVAFFHQMVDGEPLTEIDFSSLTSDGDGPGGLEDIDGDGQYDDIAGGDTVRVALIFEVEPLVDPFSGCDQYLRTEMRLDSTHIMGHSVCDGENVNWVFKDPKFSDFGYGYSIVIAPGLFLEENDETSTEVGRDIKFRISGRYDPLLIDDCPDPVRIVTISGYNSSLLEENEIIISQFDTNFTRALDIDGTTTIELEAGVNYSFLLPQIEDCAVLLQDQYDPSEPACRQCMESPSNQITVTTQLVCGTESIVTECESESYTNNCRYYEDQPLSPLHLIEQNIYRVSVGWTDSTRQQRVDPFVDSIDHLTYFSKDTMLVRMKYAVDCDISDLDFDFGINMNPRDFDDRDYNFVMGAIRWHDASLDHWLVCSTPQLDFQVFGDDRVISESEMQSCFGGQFAQDLLSRLT